LPDTALIALVLATYLGAGIVKGVVGLGLPTVTLVVLVPSVGLAPAVALTVVPTVVTNIAQAFTGGRLVAILRRLWPLVVAAVVGCFLGTGVLAGGATGILTRLLGVLLALYAATALLAPPLPPPGRLEPWLAPLVGLVSGLMAGMVGSFTMPGVVFIQALRLPRDELVQALGVVFLTLSVTLGVGLGHHALFSPPLLALSAAAVLPALAGMDAGRRIRRRLPEARFRKVFLFALLALGLNLALGAAG
jgi:hypothetical protein